MTMPVNYNGTWYDSVLELKYKLFFDKLGIPITKNRTTFGFKGDIEKIYTPDFMLDNGINEDLKKVALEVKGDFPGYQRGIQNACLCVKGGDIDAVVILGPFPTAEEAKIPMGWQLVLKNKATGEVEKWFVPIASMTSNKSELDKGILGFNLEYKEEFSKKASTECIKIHNLEDKPELVRTMPVPYTNKAITKYDGSEELLLYSILDTREKIGGKGSTKAIRFKISNMTEFYLDCMKYSSPNYVVTVATKPYFKYFGSQECVNDCSRIEEAINYANINRNKGIPLNLYTCGSISKDKYIEARELYYKYYPEHFPV